MDKGWVSAISELKMIIFVSWECSNSTPPENLVDAAFLSTCVVLWVSMSWPWCQHLQRGTILGPDWNPSKHRQKSVQRNVCDDKRVAAEARWQRASLLVLSLASGLKTTKGEVVVWTGDHKKER